jgi:hypothetical protein
VKKTGVGFATLVLVFTFSLLNIYRAATQSITIDEAYTYLSFVKPTLWEIMTRYDANHHVLHSLLCKPPNGIPLSRSHGLSASVARR